MTSRVQTVLGPVDPSVLGRTLTHEHLAMDFSHFYSAPPNQLADKFKCLPYTLDMIGYIRQYPYSSPYNLLLDDNDANSAVLEDLIAYKKFGGGTIVENTTEGIKRDISMYKRLSEASNVHVVAGTGHYIADTQNEKCLKQSTEDIYNHMLKEMTEGYAEAPEIKAGFLGEIASGWPLQALTPPPQDAMLMTKSPGWLTKSGQIPDIKYFERRAIIASGELQQQLKCGVSFHPHRIPDSPFEIIRLYLEAGGSVDKVVMSHLDRTLLKDDKLLEFAELGTYCQFDLFGTEVSYYQLSISADMPSDAQRIDKIALLVKDGREDRILMSHDIHTKHRLIRFGGHGYSHIINNVLPKMRDVKGISQEVIDKITIESPARWLEIKD